jgi:UDP-glucose 4-epimerase
MKILVAGGCGFIGANLLPMLLERGHRVCVLDNLSVGSAETLDGLNVELQVGDVRDPQAVADAVRGVEGVVHLAAHTNVVDSQHEPLLDFEINARGTLNLLLACRDQGAVRFVFASSNAPVGETTPPIDESKPPHPLSPYGASKLAGEGYCSAFCGSYGLGTVVLRFANVYGPRSSHKTSVVAEFMRRLQFNQPLVIYGDGQQTRDFIYVADLCQAINLALEADVSGEVFQIATGTETTILDLAQRLQVISGRSVGIEFVGARAGEIIKNYSDIEKARCMLDFSPAFDLERGLTQTCEWFFSQ